MRWVVCCGVVVVCVCMCGVMCEDVIMPLCQQSAVSRQQSAVSSQESAGSSTGSSRVVS
jgi:hypothetical protein